MRWNATFELYSSCPDMNYLAHATLSFEHDEILTGNMISDFVKGSKHLNYPPGIVKGIMLHRMIDEFTDKHAATKDAKTYFRESAGAYSGIFVDVVYDHFLANDPLQYDNDRLNLFAGSSYTVLEKYQNILPERFQKILPYMINQNWLFNYKFEKGIENSFNGIFRRAKYLESDPHIFNAFLKNYRQLQNCYEVFFPDVKGFAFQKFNEMIKS